MMFLKKKKQRKNVVNIFLFPIRSFNNFFILIIILINFLIIFLNVYIINNEICEQIFYYKYYYGLITYELKIKAIISKDEK